MQLRRLLRTVPHQPPVAGHISFSYLQLQWHRPWPRQQKVVRCHQRNACMACPFPCTTPLRCHFLLSHFFLRSAVLINSLHFTLLSANFNCYLRPAEIDCHSRWAWPWMNRNKVFSENNNCNLAHWSTEQLPNLRCNAISLCSTHLQLFLCQSTWWTLVRWIPIGSLLVSSLSIQSKRKRISSRKLNEKGKEENETVLKLITDSHWPASRDIHIEVAISLFDR